MHAHATWPTHLFSLSLSLSLLSLLSSLSSCFPLLSNSLLQRSSAPLTNPPASQPALWFFISTVKVLYRELACASVFLPPDCSLSLFSHQPARDSTDLTAVSLGSSQPASQSDTDNTSLSLTACCLLCLLLVCAVTVPPALYLSLFFLFLNFSSFSLYMT